MCQTYDFKLSEMKMNKPYYRDGRLRLIVKLSLPVTDCDNEKFKERFNRFYSALFNSYLDSAEKSELLSVNSRRPAFFEVVWRKTEGKEGELCIERCESLKKADHDKIMRSELDIFDTDTGLFKKSQTKKEKKSLQKKK